MLVRALFARGAPFGALAGACTTTSSSPICTLGLSGVGTGRLGARLARPSSWCWTDASAAGVSIRIGAVGCAATTRNSGGGPVSSPPSCCVSGGACSGMAAAGGRGSAAPGAVSDRLGDGISSDSLRWGLASGGEEPSPWVAFGAGLALTLPSSSSFGVERVGGRDAAGGHGFGGDRLSGAAAFAWAIFATGLPSGVFLDVPSALCSGCFAVGAPRTAS